MLDYNNQIKIIDFGLSRTYSKSTPYPNKKTKNCIQHVAPHAMPHHKWSKANIHTTHNLLTYGAVASYYMLCYVVRCLLLRVRLRSFIKRLFRGIIERLKMCLYRLRIWFRRYLLLILKKGLPWLRLSCILGGIR